MPFEDKYDPLIIALCVLELTEWLDASNTAAISVRKAKVEEMKRILVINASKNMGMNRQVKSRRDYMTPYFSPRRVT